MQGPGNQPPFVGRAGSRPVAALSASEHPGKASFEGAIRL